MGIRTALQERLIDRVQFAVDRLPRLDYQPLPWVAANNAGRATGSAERWQLVQPEVDRVGARTAVDIGCNVGFFSLSLAELGVSTLGIEREARFLRLAKYAARRVGSTNVSFMAADLRPDTMWLVPRADAVLLLSVYHHWIRHLGADTARSMLREVWAMTDRVLFFETGERELPERFHGLDVGKDPQAYLADHLAGICEDGRVRCLGTSPAFSPDERDERAAPIKRHLFAVERVR